MLNLRKLKQDFSSNILKQGKQIFDEKKVVSAKILHLDANVLRINAKILGQYNNTYESVIEIDRHECETIDSDCDCPYHYDCQHLAALLYYLDAHIDAILVEYSKEGDLLTLTERGAIDDKAKEAILEVVKEAEAKEDLRRDEQYQKELLHEYVFSSKVLSKSPFFLPTLERQIDRAELAMIFFLPKKEEQRQILELQLALRLPFRSKPLHIPNAKEFLDSLRHEEPIVIGGKRYLFTLNSFDSHYAELSRMLIDYARATDKGTTEKSQRTAFIELKSFGLILSRAFDIEYKKLQHQLGSFQDQSQFVLPCIYDETLERPLMFCHKPARFKIGIEYIDPPASKILLNPSLFVEDRTVTLEEIDFFESATPGMLLDHVFYRFESNITRLHLLSIRQMREVTIPEPLFGTFIENSLPVLGQYCEIENQHITEKFVTLPFVDKISAICELSFLDSELEADLKFKYGESLVPACVQKMTQENLTSFITPEGIVARNLVEEQTLIDEVFQDFVFDEAQGIFIAKSEKKIIEFMTDIIPRFKEKVTFNCPQNLLDQFIYDTSTFHISLSHTDRMDVYELVLSVNGMLTGIKMDRIWECVLSKRAFLELETTASRKKTKVEKARLPKILVLDLDKISKIVQLFDELRIERLSNHKIQCPLWTLANIDENNFKELPVEFKMTDQLREIRKQMLGEKAFNFAAIPKTINATLRNYQVEGVNWLERLRIMYLSGVLADDMGLGKTLQAIVAISQTHKKGDVTLVVCPTSLLYNWYEEINRFNEKLKVLVVDGVPNQRKKMIGSLKKYDVIITSYSLLQKDIELYEPTGFKYAILDEAQHIKNRGTRNAKSVKMIKAQHRLILSGTPIENSLDELWSLFDFLMPGFLSSYDRFVEKYIRVPKDEQFANLEYLRKKVAPFIMRRMKEDVLDDLPPVSEITYRCHLTECQNELYKSYAASARDELTKLVERDGFDKVQIHVLATLTRLKQICCHPAIFAKESVEEGDSAKYEMLLELVQNLIEGGHKTVIFSQYTKMLQIMKNDLIKMGIRFSYLDGSTKNRLDVVKQFNEDQTISIFLISLKAGGTGLNLVGADTVIHYDMWWNPAVENQATDRVHRIGQHRSVSVYKLVTMSTIEEKIVEMQKRKQGLVKKVVSCDEEAISKLTWEDVLELLQG
ncbi:MAG: DEAD/DEAH box helicase [Simkaniaceae bacterium]|nr:DEAD/DEAH box helicase [Simkaniaceae bacterium]